MTAPQTLLFMTVGAFVLGWLVAKVSAYFGNRYTSTERDPRDNQVRSLEAELRVSKVELERVKEQLEERDRELAETKRELSNAELHLGKQEEMIGVLKEDLKNSVRKTRELRNELTDRATQNVKSEVKLREVEAELSVAQATTDLIATGVLDYSAAHDVEVDGERRTRERRSGS